MSENKNLTCSCCKLEKSNAEFNKNPAHKTGFSNQCKACLKISSAKWRNKPGVKEAKQAERHAAHLRDKNSGKYYERLERTKDQRAEAKLKLNYKLTLNQYNQLLSNQNERCGICKKHYTEFKIALAVDHDRSCCNGSRSCGKCVRGLLCASCNNGIGRFRDSPEIILNAASYVALKGTT